ncbi:FAD/NAD(P)-binding domain-containing protein [Crassisporium funariophilum]|nr:FAD/NAD(P)-binding domain-containing protein [Crassisporium funariophilum]
MANIPDVPLPTLDRLGASIASDLDTKKVAKDWFESFAKAATAGDASTVAAMLLPEAFWRDMLALTWDMRTFSGTQKILPFLKDRLALSKLHDFSMRDEHTGLQQPFPDLAWINLVFDFSTDVGKALGITRLVPTANGEWKAHVVFTNLEGLTNFPEKLGPLRNSKPNHGKWEAQRKRDVDFTDSSPGAIIIGGGQSGLVLAARLKVLDIPTLIVERNPRVGDNWRNRYEALCLHDPVWYDHMPYLPFPPTWPVYTPSQKLASWLELYAEALELNVWTSSTTTEVTQDQSTNKWHVTIKRGDGTERKFVVNHLIFATGLGSGVPNTPKYPGMEKFKGKILHSSEHRKAIDHAGKKVVVVGACTSAHDIAVDYYEHGVDVTMFQRGSTYVMSTSNGWEVIMGGIYSEGAPPVDFADRLSASFPHHMAVGVNQRQTAYIAQLDKDLLDSLHKVGFRTNLGIKDTGFGLLAWSKAGGYYLDTGGSSLIADGKIKLKSDSIIESFDENTIKFENGTSLSADVVVFATGLGDLREQIRRVCGDDVASQCKTLWGMNDEGEINGAWRDVGVPGLWYMMGNLALCRFHSSHVALQIKAMDEGIFGTRYSAPN